VAFDLHLAHAQFIWSSLLRRGAAAGSCCREWAAFWSWAYTNSTDSPS